MVSCAGRHAKHVPAAPLVAPAYTLKRAHTHKHSAHMQGHVRRGERKEGDKEREKKDLGGDAVDAAGGG